MRHVNSLYDGQTVLSSEFTYAGTAFAFSKNGKHFAFGSIHGVVDVRRTDRGSRAVPLLDGHLHRVICVDFSPNALRLASCLNGGRIRLWSMADGGTLGVVRVSYSEYQSISSIAFSPNGHSLASASDDGVVRIWNSDLIGKTYQVQVLALTQDTEFSLRNALDGTLISEFNAQSTFACNAPDHHGSYAPYGTVGGEIQVRNAQQSSIVGKSWKSHPFTVTHISFSRDGT